MTDKPAKTTHAVARDVAEDEFQRMIAAFDIEAEDLEPEDLEVFEQKKAECLKLIQQGHITVDAEGLPTLKLKHPVGAITAIPYSLPTAQTLVAAGDSKQNHVTRTFALLSDLTGVPKLAISKLSLVDWRRADFLAGFFLG